MTDTLTRALTRDAALREAVRTYNAKWAARDRELRPTA